eukprot:1341505-Rhodomonas_salina.2
MGDCFTHDERLTAGGVAPAGRHGSNVVVARATSVRCHWTRAVHVHHARGVPLSPQAPKAPGRTGTTPRFAERSNLSGPYRRPEGGDAFPHVGRPSASDGNGRRATTEGDNTTDGAAAAGGGGWAGGGGSDGGYQEEGFGPRSEYGYEGDPPHWIAARAGQQRANGGGGIAGRLQRAAHIQPADLPPRHSGPTVYPPRPCMPAVGQLPDGMFSDREGPTEINTRDDNGHVEHADAETGYLVGTGLSRRSRIPEGQGGNTYMEVWRA